MKKPIRANFDTALAAALIFAMTPMVTSIGLAGCSGGGGMPVEPDEFTGCGSDEQWITLGDAEPSTTVSDTAAPQLTAPDAATLASPLAQYPKAIFRWNIDANLPGMPTGDVAYMDGVNGCNSCCPQFNIGALTSAHLPSISGDVYDLQFSEGGNMVYRVVTTLQEWTAPDDVWSKWAGQSLSLKIYRISVLSNDLKEGPYVASTASTFSVANQ